MSLPVLIVGAGPTGLNLALRLSQAGARFRIIDKNSGPAQASRALAIQARTLELYDQLGLADAIVANGVRIERAHFLEDGDEKALVSLRDIGSDLTPYAFMLDYPQDEHERFLVAELKKRGVGVEWNTALSSFSQGGQGVDCTLETANGSEQIRVDWLCGCDGARSVVRTGIGVTFDGGTYEHLYYVADVKIAGERSDDAYIAMGRDTFALRMPARQGTAERIIGLVPDTATSRGDPNFDDVRATAEHLLQVQVRDVNWFSTYRVHHRVAGQFKVGRAFLCGDAGHLHSPAGGQGMNTGIGDAVNLGWKLGEVVTGRASPTILDTYEPERIPFARLLVATTDRVFQAVVSGGLPGGIVRHLVVPHILPAATRFEAGRNTIFRILSQTRIAYKDSTLSRGKAGRIEAGERLPWVANSNNYEPLRSCAWQVHVYGECPAAFDEALRQSALPVHVFPFTDAAARVGLAEGAAYLVRPDGYVGVAQASPDSAQLISYIDHLGIAGRSSDSRR